MNSMFTFCYLDDYVGGLLIKTFILAACSKCTFLKTIPSLSPCSLQKSKFVTSCASVLQVQSIRYLSHVSTSGSKRSTRCPPKNAPEIPGAQTVIHLL